MKKFFVTILLLFMITGCGAKDQVFEPEEIEEGVDRCAVCNMLVPNDYNATQIMLSDGRSLKFDDIGCMAAWEQENGLDDVNARYVRDYYTEEWLLIEEATFVYDPELRTPMAYGVVSFSSKDDAEKFVKEQGKGTVLTYEELQQHEWERNMELMKLMKEEMGSHNHMDANEEMNSQDHSDMGTNEEMGSHDHSDMSTNGDMSSHSNMNEAGHE